LTPTPPIDDDVEVVEVEVVEVVEVEVDGRRDAAP
jgi:hypothetical protein